MGNGFFNAIRRFIITMLGKESMHQEKEAF